MTSLSAVHIDAAQDKQLEVVDLLEEVINGDSSDEQLSVDDFLEQVNHRASAEIAEAAVQVAGGFGLYQYRLMALLFVTYGSVAIVMMEPVFLTPLSKEGDLGLSDGQARFVTSVFFGAFFVGLYIWGFVGDTFGRRFALILALLGLCVSAGTAPCMSTYATFLTFRGLSGVAAAGVLNTTFVMALEFAPCSWRATTKGVLAVGWVTGSVLLVFCAWLVRHTHSMRWFSICVAPAVLALLLSCTSLLPESPRFLLAKGRRLEAHELLIEIARVNLGTSATEATERHSYPQLSQPSTSAQGAACQCMPTKHTSCCRR